MATTLVAAALLLQGGCGFFDNPTPSEARLTVTGESGAEVRIVTSKKFVATQQTGDQVKAELLAADTLVRTLPFDTVYDIRGDLRFYARIDTVGSTVPSGFRLRVALDEEVRYDQEGSLVARVFRFLYVFNQAILTDGEVL